jgi:hypothetical protein
MMNVYESGRERRAEGYLRAKREVLEPRVDTASPALEC